MRALVTAGSTMTMIDQVRGITNIFGGQTGLEIARHFAKQGNIVHLLTSQRQNLNDFRPGVVYIRYRTFVELQTRMQENITTENFDVIIHSSAVSDYEVEGVFQMKADGNLEQVDAKTKVKSGAEDLFFKLRPTIKLVDQIRGPWGFNGVLVKFKLQVGISDEELIAIANKSRKDSEANFIVANCLEWSRQYAYIIDEHDKVERVERFYLPEALLQRLT